MYKKWSCTNWVLRLEWKQDGPSNSIGKPQECGCAGPHEDAKYWNSRCGIANERRKTTMMSQKLIYKLF